MQDALKVFKIPISTKEVYCGSKFKGQYFSIGKNNEIIFQDINGQIGFCKNEATVLSNLGSDCHTPPKTFDGYMDILVIGAILKDKKGFLTFAHIFDYLYKEATMVSLIDISNNVYIFNTATDAIVSLWTEIMWRAGWLDGEYGALETPPPDQIMTSVKKAISLA